MAQSMQGKIDKAAKREQMAKLARERREKRRRLFILVIAILLALGLSVPTASLIAMSGIFHL